MFRNPNTIRKITKNEQQTNFNVARMTAAVAVMVAANMLGYAASDDQPYSRSVALSAYITSIAVLVFGYLKHQQYTKEKNALITQGIRHQFQFDSFTREFSSDHGQVDTTPAFNPASQITPRRNG